MDIEAYIAERVAWINAALDRYLPPPGEYPPVINEAVRYSVFSGGKRLRPVLMIAAAEAVGGEAWKVMPAACAAELIHTYSLVHDDLPAMDNDDFRRGVPTSHRVYGEAIAILAGDALLTRAFGLLASNARISGVDKEAVLRVIEEFSFACGSSGLVGGQVADVLFTGREAGPEVVDYIHRHKTAALFRVTVRAGAILSGAAESELSALTAFGEHYGVAFQMLDDIADAAEDVLSRGSEKKKVSSVATWGLEEARNRAERTMVQAVEALKPLGDRGRVLVQLARYTLQLLAKKREGL